MDAIFDHVQRNVNPGMSFRWTQRKEPDMEPAKAEHAGELRIASTTGESDSSATFHCSLVPFFLFRVLFWRDLVDQRQNHRQS